MGRKRIGPGFEEEENKRSLVGKRPDAPSPVNGFVFRAICDLYTATLFDSWISLSQYRTDTDMLPAHVYLRVGAYAASLHLTSEC